MKIFKLFATDLMQRQSDHLPQLYQHMIQHDHENTVSLLVKKRDVIGSDFYRCCQAFGKLSDKFNFEKFILEPLIGSILSSDDPFDPLYDLKDFYEKKDETRLVEVLKIELTKSKFDIKKLEMIEEIIPLGEEFSNRLQWLRKWFIRVFDNSDFWLDEAIKMWFFF